MSSFPNNQELDDLFLDIQTFLKSKQRNTYVGNSYITIYIRKSMRGFDNKLINFFDIGNIEVVPEYQNKGYFTQFLIRLLKEYPNMNIFVESILNPILTNKLKQFGFKEQRINEYQLNMYLIQQKTLN